MLKALKNLQLQDQASTVLKVLRKGAVTTIMDPFTGASRKQTTPLALAPADEKIEGMSSLLSAAISFERCYRGKPLKSGKPMADWEYQELHHDLAWVFRSVVTVARRSTATYIETSWVRELLQCPALLVDSLYLDALRRRCSERAEEAISPLRAILDSRGIHQRASLTARIASENAGTILVDWVCRIEGDEECSKSFEVDWFAGCADLPATLLEEARLVGMAFSKVTGPLTDFLQDLRRGSGFKLFEARASRKNQAAELCQRLFGSLTQQQRELLRQHPQLVSQYI